MTGLEIWNGYPCGEKVSCFDTMKTILERKSINVTSNPSGIRVSINQGNLLVLGVENKQYNLFVYNVLGKCVLNAQSQGNKRLELNSNVNSGIYMVQIEVSGISYFYKITILR
ncbi:MAG: T9SS type A sorting domain-containing protein [Fibrobacteres bacterium]|nr:T9SS type A sorting domain-containing protein [Fibrobacterota bacterium]